jgi:MFS family permease
MKTFRDLYRLGSSRWCCTAGLVFGIPPLVYSASCLWTGTIANCWGNKKTVAAGLLVVGVSFILLGPIPWLDGLPFSVAVGWIVVTLCLMGIGVGSALIVVPSVPMMLASMENHVAGKM